MLQNEVQVSALRNMQPSLSGWKPEELELLIREVDASKSQGGSLRAAFEKVASATGRKVNSIRNYYYSFVKKQEDSEKADDQNGDAKAAQVDEREQEQEMGNAIRFITFSEEEKRELMRTMLEAQARGMSVRGCANLMGKRDKSALLRYQNKYRNLLRSDPNLVQEIMNELEQEGIAYFDPYKKVTVGDVQQLPSLSIEEITEEPEEAQELPGLQPEEVQEENFIEIISGIVQDMQTIQGQDVVSLFKGIAGLTRMATRQLYSRKKADEYDRLTVKYDLLLIEAEKMEQEIQTARNREISLEKIIHDRDCTISELKSQLLTLDSRNDMQKQKTARMLNLFRQLMSLNKNFLGLNSVNKVTNLTSYTYELSQCVDEYEKIISEYD